MWRIYCVKLSWFTWICHSLWSLLKLLILVFGVSVFSVTYPCHVSFYDCIFTSMKYLSDHQSTQFWQSSLFIFLLIFLCLIERFQKLFFSPKRLLVDKFCDIMWHLNGVTQRYPCDNMTHFNELFIEENCHSH